MTLKLKIPLDGARRILSTFVQWGLLLRLYALLTTLIVWIIVSACLSLFHEPLQRKVLTHTEHLARIENRKIESGEISRNQKLLQLRLLNLNQRMDRIYCQQDMIVAATRSGWRAAEKLILSGAYSTCGKNEPLDTD